MLIPSIDLMGGKIVQLVQGEKKALEFADIDRWIQRFRAYPLVQLIDLDAAMGRGDNRSLITEIVSQLPCQVGGGIRSVESAAAMIATGAKRVIIGSALFDGDEVNRKFAQELKSKIGEQQLVFAVDSKHGFVAVHGWRKTLKLTAAEAIGKLEPFCAAFLYTHIDTEGLLTGFPIERALELRKLTTRQLIVAGGIRALEEVSSLNKVGVDAVAGMAIYSGLMPA
jgi:phosphoribosylformimino-5-aminoimidazole carboxamide ribotide isomerase